MSVLKVSSEIYSYSSIIRAIDDYKNLATISKKVVDRFIIVEFTNCKYDEDLTLKEFENYLIGLENT